VHGGGSNGEADCLGGDCDVPIWAEERSVILGAVNEVRDDSGWVGKGVRVERKGD